MKTDKKTYNKEIDEAVERVNNGQFVSNEEVMKEIDNLFVKPILFLDHDGVVCLSTEWGSRLKNKEGLDSVFDRFNDKAIKVLNQIIEETDCEIVISSDWRFHAPLEQMQELYRIRGIKKVPIGYTKSGLDWKQCRKITPDNDLAATRSFEILNWLEEHPEVTKWVAVDDLNMSEHFGEISDNYLFGLTNFVHTPRSKEGIKQSGIKEKIIKFLK
jgi:hypothetical protein